MRLWEFFFLLIVRLAKWLNSRLLTDYALPIFLKINNCLKMEAKVKQGTPAAVDQLASRLSSDCGSEVEIVSNGFSNGGAKRIFTIKLASKKQNLVSICQATDLTITKFCSKRSEAYVSTEIELSVDTVSPVTALA